MMLLQVNAYSEIKKRVLLLSSCVVITNGYSKPIVGQGACAHWLIESHPSLLQITATALNSEHCCFQTGHWIWFFHGLASVPSIPFSERWKEAGREGWIIARLRQCLFLYPRVSRHKACPPWGSKVMKHSMILAWINPTKKIPRATLNFRVSSHVLRPVSGHLSGGAEGRPVAL